MIDPADLAEEARRIGLDGLCLAEHDAMWDPDEVEQLARDSGIVILRANEVSTNHGHVLVFGYDEKIPGVLAVFEELSAEVARAGGLTVVSHPFRGFLLFGVAEFQMSVEEACERTVFQHVDGVEILNGMVREQGNDMARRVAERLNLVGVAGSDAHRLDELGRCVTILEREISTEQELIEELRSGRFTTGSLR
jgi:predicted metal-dependent phosphoesterase TrpH